MQLQTPYDDHMEFLRWVNDITLRSTSVLIYFIVVCIFSLQAVGEQHVDIASINLGKDLTV